MGKYKIGQKLYLNHGTDSIIVAKTRNKGQVSYNFIIVSKTPYGYLVQSDNQLTGSWGTY